MHYWRYGLYPGRENCSSLYSSSSLWDIKVKYVLVWNEPSSAARLIYMVDAEVMKYFNLRGVYFAE